MTRRLDVVGIDASILMHPTTWKASGHLDGFTDPLVDCKSCKTRFREDHAPKREEREDGGGRGKREEREDHAPNRGQGDRGKGDRGEIEEKMGEKEKMESLSVLSVVQRI